jgi:endo-1,4-beta-D-glucanase Y
MFKRNHKMRGLVGVLMALAFTLLSADFVSAAVADNKPFPQAANVKYARYAIKPAVPQTEMNNAVTVKWNLWKAAYLKSPGTSGGTVACSALTASDQCYVQCTTSGCGDGDEVVSEGQGYGMMLTVLMAGPNEPNAQVYFDKLYRYYRNHPSKSHSSQGGYLMAWLQDSNLDDVESDSATDGDLDIAYSLLLADQQWGGLAPDGVSYLQAAQRMINEIMQYDVNQTESTLMIGDAISPGSATGRATRPSDFMLNHLRAFIAVSDTTHQQKWRNVINKTYYIEEFISNLNPTTGLLPDFIIKPTTTGPYQPAGPNFSGEGPYTGEYHYNSGRSPWRIATDYLVSGDQRPLIQVQTMNTWIKSVANTPTNIRAGYYLNGNPLPGSNYSTAVFIAPFGVAAMVGANNQAWLNAIWNNYLIGSVENQYYEDSIRLLSMVVISGNWWTPPLMN